MTPGNTGMSSPRLRKPASSVMPLGCVTSLAAGRHAPALADRLLSSFSSPASPLQVGGAFQEPRARQELATIGSAPSQDHVFKVDNFAALGSIQKQLQEKIFAVEGNWGTGFDTEEVPPQ